MNGCPECGAAWTEGKTCQDGFHQMLFWESEYPDYGMEIHFLMVLAYHLQHPSLYSPEGLNEARQLLASYLEQGLSPTDLRQRNRARVDSGKRKWKIKATATARGSYEHPVGWTLTAADVVAGGADHYSANVQRWARSIQAALQASDNYAVTKP